MRGKFLFIPWTLSHGGDVRTLDEVEDTVPRDTGPLNIAPLSEVGTESAEVEALLGRDSTNVSQEAVQARSSDPGWVRLMHAFRKPIDALSGWCGKVSMYLSIALLFVGFVNVVLRYYGRETNQALVGEEITDLQSWFFGIIFLFGFSYILREDINVRVDFYYGKFAEKKKAFINAFGHILFLIPFCIMGVYLMIPETLRAAGQRPNGSWPSGWRIWETWRDSGNAGSLPSLPMHVALILGFTFLGVQALVELFKAIFVLKGYDHLANLEEADTPMRVE